MSHLEIARLRRAYISIKLEYEHQKHVLFQDPFGRGQISNWIIR